MTGTVVGSLNQALRELLADDPRTVLIGEDIVDPYGGAFKVTHGLSSAFPGRVLSTPISEAAICGICGGMALRGMRPIAEVMFGDFVTLCMDQVVNHIAKFRAMYDQTVDTSLVLRTPMGGGRGYGPTHSQSLEKMLMGVPHLKVVAPSRFHDPGALLKAAAADPGPVVFVEHKLLYPTKLLSAGGLAAGLAVEQSGLVEFPTVQVSNCGGRRPDVVLITYGGASLRLDELLLQLADDEVDVVVAMPSLLNRVDASALAAVAASATAGVVIWEEGTGGFDWAAELIAGMHEAANTPLPPVRRLASVPTVIPAARHLEQVVIPNHDSAKQAVFELLRQSMERR